MDSEDFTSLSELDREAEQLRQANMHSLHKISQLQAKISQLRSKLAIKGKDLEAVRRKVKADLARRAQLTQATLQGIVTFIELLEEENRDLRELATIPVEIEKMKGEVVQMNQRKQSCDLRFRDYLSPETTSGTQSLMGQISSEVAQLRSEVSDFKRKLTEETQSRTHLQDVIVPSLETSKAALQSEIAHLRCELKAIKEKSEESVVSFRPNSQGRGQMTSPRAAVSRASASVRIPATMSVTKPRKSDLTLYSPTFLRTPKVKRPIKTKTQPLFSEAEADRGETATPELAFMKNGLVAK